MYYACTVVQPSLPLHVILKICRKVYSLCNIRFGILLAVGRWDYY